MPDFDTVKNAKNAQNLRRALLQLNRPGGRNAISRTLPGDIQCAGKRTEADSGEHVMLVEGVSRGFCA